MKTWQAIALTAMLFIVLILIGSQLPARVSNGIILTVNIILAGWTLFDGNKIELKKYKSWFASTPGAWAIGILMLWPIFLPAYLSFRYKILNGLAPLKTPNIGKK